MDTERKCMRCGGTNLEPGRVQSTGRLYFRPANARFLTFLTGNVPVEARMCMDCGTLEFVGDVKRAAALVPPQEQAKGE